ncbi:hypothetical protein DICPUDRAFT_155776 [Dictyostelium purpureum]|uniref:RGS domain-containing protein n=1 Tax=Dictyostelium purpureum TaxID=5786 RepID=F0ZUV0_DICPU|nr:uncharacterized protein DICPUDRAFT_155776 [Dictyostelium purpureum]EGC32280.1 hypothetical protein DICPUDRAFT_155776 [Dictyostelium purpureum]|eukprot:XP_003291189.1 hypothetical protein DICPUDRAFT_155776 [Dictyostelium purpureum]
MDSRLDVNTMGLTSTLVSKLFDNLSGSLDVTLSNLMTNESDRYGLMSGGSSGGSGSSLNIASTNISGGTTPPTITATPAISPTSSTTNIANLNLNTASGSPNSTPTSSINSLSPNITNNIGSGGLTPSSSHTNIPSLNASGSIGRSSLTLSPNSLMSIGSGSLGGSGGSSSGSQIGSSTIKMSKGNTLIRKLATSGKILNIDQSETEWTNFARNFWFYYPSLMLISESSKYCKESAIRLVLEYLPKHIQQLQSSSAVNSPSQSTTVSPTLTTLGGGFSGSIGKASNISNNITSNANINGNNTQTTVTAGFNFSLTVQQQQQSNSIVSNTITTTTTTTTGSTATFTTLGPGGIQSPSSSLSNVLCSSNQSQSKHFSFEQFLSTISSYHQGSDTKYLDLIESTVEIVVADIITHILGKVDFSQVSSNSNPPLSMFLINRLRDLAFYYFKPINARSLNFSTWISLRLSISDQWSLILGQISRISLIPISQYLTKTVQNNPPLDDLIPLFKGIRWVSLVLTDSEKINEVEKLLGQMYNWIDNNKKNVLRLVQLEALDGMLLSMTDYTQSTNIVAKMREIFKKAEKLLKNDEFEDRSSKLMCSIISRGPPSFFEEDYEGIMKRIWKSISVPKKRDFSLECILRLLQGRFVPPRKISGLQTYLSTNTSNSSTNGGIAAQLQLRLDRVYENSGSYLYAGLIFNRGKVIPRLQEIIQGLFGKKQNIPKPIECIDLLTAISVHISVHSLKLLTDSILPTLFSSNNPLYHVIALRTLSIILDPTGVFWNTAYSANSKSISGLSSQNDNITYVRKEEIQLTFETFLSKSFKHCEEQSGLPQNNSLILNGDNPSISQDPLTISTQFEPTISLYSLINESSTVHHHKFENDTTIDAIKRWYEVCTKSVEQREREQSEQTRVLSISLNNKIEHWEKNNSLISHQSEPFTTKKKTIRKKTMNPDLLELFKETIRCITFIPKNFILHSNLHKLVLHEEEEIASAASHAIQVIMCDHPELRTPLVQGFTSLILQYVGKDHASLQTLLSQLLGLIDLWNERSFIESRHASVPLDSSFFPPKMLETEIEAIGLVHLSSPVPSTRLIALQIIRSISGIRNTEIHNTQIASVIHQKWRTIAQRARHHLLLDNACGIDKEIKLNPNDDLPSAEELVLTTHDRLWAITLCEIGRMCTEHDCVRTLSKARGILLNIINLMPQVPTESTTDENKRYNNYILKYLWINSHSLLLSTSGIASSYPLRPTPQEASQDPLVDEMIKFESNLQGKITQYLPTFWNGLLSDISPIREKLSFICGLLHWRLIPTLIDSLNEWWTQNKQNKKLSRVRVDLSNIFRRISQHKDFPRAIFESQDLVQVFVQFIQQIDPIFGDPTKLPSINNESYFNDNAVVVYNFCNSLFTPTLCALNGPIRKSLISSIKSIPWTVGERYKTFKAILQWSGHPNVSQQRMQLEGFEINKRLSKIKDSFREDEKARIEAALRKIRDCSRLAAESILKLGTLFEEGKLQKEVLEWVVDSELKGNRILRWVLSYHFDEAYAYFLSRCYIDNPAESVLYLHSIYDQFLPIPPINPPTLGITQDIYQYYFDKALEEKDQEDLEDEPVTIIDKQFSRKLVDIGASLLFLSLLNLLHPAFLARIRSFDLIARLSPSSFGLSTEENVLIRSQLLPRRQSFSSRNTPTNKINALEVSSLVSQTCPLWTEKLFEEVFHRFKNLNTQNKKWTIQFLLPWCNNISFVEGRMTRMVPVEFLKQFFAVLTESITPTGNNTEMMPELIDLWLALARKEPQNLMVIINFLVKKSISNRDHMPICKLIILYIYRMDPERTLEPLIYQLSYSGVSHSIGNEKRLSAGLSDNDLGNLEGNEVDRNKLSRQSSKIRETCVIILTDLISENLVPVMPYLHIVFNYSILRIDSTTESPLLQKMINILLSGLRNNLYAQTFVANNEEAKQQSRSILKSFDTILTSLRLPTFQIKFDFNDDSIHPIGFGSISGSSIGINGTLRRDVRNNEIINQSFIGFDNKNPIVSIYSKRKASFLVQGSKTSSSNHMNAGYKDSVIDHRNEMIKWCNGYIYADELISVLCKYFEVVTPATIDRWENESLYWIKNYKDPRVSIKSCQMYRSIIQCQQQLVNNNLNSNNLIMKTLKRQKVRWASSVEHLVTLLQEWTEDLDNCLINLTKLSNQINYCVGGSSQQLLIKSFNEQQNLAIFKRTLCVEILLTLKQIIQSKNIDENSLSLIFWSSVSLIVPTQLFYKPLYETSLEIISQISKMDDDDDDDNLEKANQDIIRVPLFVKHILENSQHINIPRGIQYHLFKGLLSPSTEEVCSRLLVCLVSVQSDSLASVQQIDPMGPPQRYLLPILALAPWLHNRILTSKSSIIYREQKIAADKIATALSQVLVSSVGKGELPQNQELSEIFSLYSKGGFNSNPDSFLIKVISCLRSLVIPKFSIECSDLMTTLLDSSSSLSNSILKVINLLLEGASPQVLPLFKNIIKIACDYGSSLPVAADLINSVVSTMKNSIPQNNLPPLLPPIDKTSSEILKQILVPVKHQQQLQQQQLQQAQKQAQQQQAQQQKQAEQTSPLSMSQEQNKKKGHRRNKSPISDHPSLKERAINEKKSQPVSPPQFSNVFNPPASIQQQQEEIVQEIEQEIEQDELDLDEFDEFDDEEMKNLMENDPTLTRSMSKSMWRNSDEYNAYLDLDENDLDLEDLKVGLEGLDSNILNKFGNSTSTSKRSSRSLNQSSEESEELRNSSSRSSRSHSTTSNTGLSKSRSRSSSSASQPRDRSSSTTSQTQQPLTSSTKQPSFSLITPSSNKNRTSSQKPGIQEHTLGQDSIESLRALLGTSDLTSSKRNSDSIQIDQLLSNLKNFDQNDETYAQLESEFDDLLTSDSPQASFLNLVPSGSTHSPSSTISSTGLGIKEILNDSKKRRSFLDFLKKQHFQKAVNDVCFVEVVNDFKSDIEGSGKIGGDGLLYLMRHIVEGFVNENSKHSISITEKVRQKVVQSYQEFISDGNNIDPSIFDEALDMVFKALEDKSILDAFISSQYNINN